MRTLKQYYENKKGDAMKTDSNLWEVKKSEILDNIDVALERSSENKEVLEIMKELLQATKVVNTMEEYMEEKEI